MIVYINAYGIDDIECELDADGVIELCKIGDFEIDPTPAQMIVLQKLAYKAAEECMQDVRDDMMIERYLASH